MTLAPLLILALLLVTACGAFGGAKDLSSEEREQQLRSLIDESLKVA